MRERHSALVLHIGTFAEEDEAYKLLSNLSILLPLTVLITGLLDALVAAIYLKWLHPWKILLQEVSSLLVLVPALEPVSHIRNQSSGRHLLQRIWSSRTLRWSWLFYGKSSFFLLIFQEIDDLQIIDDATATATDGQEVKFLAQFLAI